MVNRNRTDNTMVNRNRTDNAMVNRNRKKTNNDQKTLHRKLTIEQHETLKKRGINSGLTSPQTSDQ
jgi:hypothetical protein